MSVRRKREESALDSLYAGMVPAGRGPAPEAFEYEDDVDPKVVEAVQEKANKVIGDRKLVVIDGYAIER